MPAKRIYRDFTPAEKSRIDKLRAEAEKDRPEIEEFLRALNLAHKNAKNVIGQLKAERERQGLSLSEVQDRTGIARTAISAIENADAPNPTIKTLQRYALALGLKLELSVR
jgi:DNA-binding XRE family transcriptional regulator